MHDNRRLQVNCHADSQNPPLRSLRPDEAVNPAAVIAALVRMAKAGEAVKTAAAIREARLTMIEAWKVQLATERNREAERGSRTLEERMMYLKSTI